MNNDFLIKGFDTDTWTSADDPNRPGNKNNFALVVKDEVDAAEEKKDLNKRSIKEKLQFVKDNYSACCQVRSDKDYPILYPGDKISVSNSISLMEIEHVLKCKDGVIKYSFVDSCILRQPHELCFDTLVRAKTKNICDNRGFPLLRVGDRIKLIDNLLHNTIEDVFISKNGEVRYILDDEDLLYYPEELDFSSLIRE